MAYLEFEGGVLRQDARCHFDGCAQPRRPGRPHCSNDHWHRHGTIIAAHRQIERYEAAIKAQQQTIAVMSAEPLKILDSAG